MVHALIVVLTCAAAVAATSYADYSGLKMPQYGSAADYDLGRDPPSHPSDDYHGHSPDAPASLDYKFEEKPRDKTDKPSKDTDELDVWRKTEKRQKELIRPAKSDNNMRHKYHDDEEDDEIPNFTTNRRYFKNRSRHKNDIDQTEEQIPVRRHNKYNRDRKYDISDIDRKEYLHLDKEYVPEDKNKEFDEDGKFLREVTTKRPIRRRPREKDFKRRQSEDEYVEENWSDFTMKTEKDDKYIPRLNEEIRRQRLPEMRIGPAGGRGRERDHERDRERQRTRFQPGSDEEEDARMDPIKVISGKFKPKAYDEYDDYYDMKRVQNIKSKLPSLLMRRTTVRVTRTRARFGAEMNVDQQERTNSRRLKVYIETKTESIYGPMATRTERMPTPTRRMPTPTPVLRIQLTRTPTRPFPSTMFSTTQTTTAQTFPTTTTKRKTTTRKLTTIIKEISKETSSEQPRLWPDIDKKIAILQKAQRKEGLNFQSTQKPPVLLQVTRYVPTVVMVEPPTPPNSNIRSGQKINDEPPEVLLKVKRLMRRKLVANAKNIHELTDDWDNVVCDYIDTSLLSSTSKAQMLSHVILCLYCLQLYVFVIL